MGNAKRVRSGVVALALALAPVGWGQEVSAAAQALAAAQRAVAEARATYQGAPTFDRPLWREAVRQGEAARALEPHNPEVLRFLAETYSTLSWDVRAWDAWEALLQAGGELSADDLAQMFAAGRELGYARYTAGELAAAETVFSRMVQLDPENVDALTWLGRIALERGDSVAARAHWARVLELRPNDPTARYYLGRSEQQLAFGAEASGAFHEGLAAYDGGDLEGALAAFTRAAEANADFEEAFVWAARTALEAGQPEVAQRYAEALLARDPEHERAGFFMQQIALQRTWGAEAGSAFLEGQGLYSQGRVAEAAERFAAASDANTQFLEAATWAARSYQETGQAARAATYWERVVALSPDDARARFFLEEARAQSGVAPAAVSAFNRGLRAYADADLAAAEAAFAEATREDPAYAEAWGWLGRLAFEGGRYAEAAAAYAQASALEPADETYAFFAAEARRLAER
ncbi:tetratricopeptide repeat protein [Truepera radiovictrix]|uniref:Tetratricopeptide TPR_2 repeat protein n=1 Tax=Truepera radiovictrix (strain DSM 17093 / CIP 108686 / LMG 22925 / RQ-24) TaxID=649638 RepID=D7CX92_TRURR|nr:tetratricopeptide repeat protein [Truepera radiovictrix]ADI13216.1 Tetratricopeptide TPR_2 repeat protein [Truepera radiovictrix DSM 17093]WMT58219.1 tetratricopeptide repeat protein [Truepera radiovictrix]